jgi:hypothetical protein
MSDEWESEIQTLSAIFMDEVEVVSDDRTKVKVINEESVLSAATLVINCPDKNSYPSSRAVVSVEDLAISPENLLYITNKLQKLIDDNLGYSMIFDVIELLRGELQLISKFDSQGLFTFLAKETILAILHDCDLNSIWNLTCSSKIFFEFFNEDMFKYFHAKTLNFKYENPPLGRTWKENCKLLNFNSRHILRYALPFLERKGLPEPMPNASNWMDWVIKELQIADPRISYVCSRVYVDEEKRYSIIFKSQKTADLDQVAFQIGSLQFFSPQFSKERALFPIVTPKRECQWSGQDTILGWCNIEFGSLYDNSEGQQLLKTLLYLARGSLYESKKKTEAHVSLLDRKNVEMLLYNSYAQSTPGNTWYLLCDPLKEKSIVFNVKFNQATGKVIFAQVSKKKKSSITYHLLSSFSDIINLNEVDQDNLLKDNNYLYTIVSNIVHECKLKASLKKGATPQIVSLEVTVRCWICDVVLTKNFDLYHYTY